METTTKRVPKLFTKFPKLKKETKTENASLKTVVCAHLERGGEGGRPRKLDSTSHQNEGSFTWAKFYHKNALSSHNGITYFLSPG
jgi:hypothetical protein